VGLCHWAAAQTAELSGVVKDSSLAPLSGAAITVSNQNTGITRTTLSNRVGHYTVSYLPPGSYSVKVEAAGFKTLERSGITLTVAEVGSLDFVLSVATRGEVVTVHGDLNSGSSEFFSVGTTVDREFVGNLPLNGRTFQTLIALTPGVISTRGDGQFSVNGQRDDANYFTIDGVSANVGISALRALGQTAGGAIPGLNVLGATNNLLSVDALQEFRIQSSSYSAEFGRTPGGQVQIVSRSGTNQIHGGVFDYFRNDVLDANDWFANAQGLSKSMLRQNDFGITLGGPISRNLSFFFLSYEGLRLRQPQFAEISVPSISAREQAPEPIAQLLRAFPLPNGVENSATMIAQFSARYSNPVSVDTGSVRVDQKITNRLSLFGRFSDARSRARTRVGSLTQVRLDEVNTSSLTLGATWAAAATITNELRANYTRNEGSHFNHLDNFGGAVAPPDALLFTAPFASPRSSRFIFFEGADGLRFVSGRSSDHVQRQLNIVDGFSMVSGSHALKFGVDYRHLTPIFGPQDYGLETDFDTVPAAVAGATPNASIFVFDRVTLSFHNLSLYGQDTWRPFPRLTVAYGLRWELNPAPSAMDGQHLYTLDGFDDLSTARVATAGTPLYGTTYANFAPRFGVAYRLSQQPGRESVAKGGFGIFYDLGTGAIGDAAQFFPHRRQKTVTGLPFPLNEAAAPPPAASLDPPYAGQAFLVFDPEIVPPRTFEWNVALQQSLGTMQTISVSYVGASGRDLLRREFVAGNSPNFPSSGIDITTNTATSEYHALQIQLQRRLARGIQGLASYSWSHSIDIASNDFDDQIPSTHVLPEVNRGSSDFDVRHTFNAAFVYDLPRLGEGALGWILQGWSVEGIFTARTAMPVNVTVIRTFKPDRIAVNPDLVPGVPLYLSDSTIAGGKRINPAAFATPLEQRQGNLGRNALRGFPVYELDLSVGRVFNVRQAIKLQLRADAFNLLNHPNFADPSGSLGVFRPPLSPNSLFGVSTAMLANTPVDGVTTGLTPLFHTGGPRSLQISLRLDF